MLGTTVPVGLLLLLIFAIIVLVGIFSRRKERNEWEMDYSELEIGEQMGAGGYARRTNRSSPSIKGPWTDDRAVMAGTALCTRPNGAERRWQSRR